MQRVESFGPSVFQFSEEEDVLHAVDPNEVFPRGPPADPSSESDSGISEDPAVENPITTAAIPPVAPATVYQVVYDLSSVKTEPGENVISIELGENPPIRQLCFGVGELHQSV